MITWNYHNPVRLLSSPVEALANHVTSKRLLLVTTPGFVRRGVTQRLCELLASSQVTVWDGVRPNPDLQDLDVAIKNLEPLGIESVVGLGGGSALDAAKILATTLAAPVSTTLMDVFRFGAKAPWDRRLPLILIPTTSGTGSEVTPFATIWDHEEHKKHSLAGHFVFPDLALLDAALTLTLNQDDTLYPALDAISHALESLWNKNITPVSRAFAFQSLNLSSHALPLVLVEPLSLKARQDLLIASAMAGLAISQTRTALAHSISYPITSHFGIPHGLACSFTLPKLLNKNMSMLFANDGEQLVLEKIHQLLITLNLSKRLAKYVDLKNLLTVEQEMLTPGRADNYQGVDITLRELVTAACLVSS